MAIILSHLLLEHYGRQFAVSSSLKSGVIDLSTPTTGKSGLFLDQNILTLSLELKTSIPDDCVYFLLPVSSLQSSVLWPSSTDQHNGFARAQTRDFKLV